MTESTELTTFSRASSGVDASDGARSSDTRGARAKSALKDASSFIGPPSLEKAKAIDYAKAYSTPAGRYLINGGQWLYGKVGEKAPWLGAALKTGAMFAMIPAILGLTIGGMTLFQKAQPLIKAAYQLAGIGVLIPILLMGSDIGWNFLSQE